MRVIDLIHSNEKTAFSFEILPPLKGTGIEKLCRDIDTLREFDPKYINITTHRSEYVYKDLGNGLFQRNRLRRRPGTVAVAAAIQNKYNITVVPHILCSGFTREETEYVLLDLQFLGITDLLVLRGDKAKHESIFTPEGDGYHHAIELQEQINNFNKGIFPGFKPFKKASELSMIPKTFKVDLPDDLVKETLKCKNDAEVQQVGVEWCIKQCRELMAHGVPSIHFYSIGAVDSIKEVAKEIY